jgi:hypothetical protein
MSATARIVLAATLLTVPALAGCGGSGKSHPASTTGTTTAPTSGTATSSQPSSAAPVQGVEVSPGIVRATSDSLAAGMHAGTHTPTVGRAWPIAFSVQRAGRPAAAAVSYEYLFAGQVVARRSHYRFRGRFSDVFRWPSSAVGYPLTFRAVIESGGSTVHLDYAVRVRR